MSKPLYKTACQAEEEEAIVAVDAVVAAVVDVVADEDTATKAVAVPQEKDFAAPSELMCLTMDTRE